MKKQILSLLSAFAVTLGFGSILTGCGAVNVDLNNYIEFDTEGYNGYGTVEYKFNAEEFEKDYGDTIKFTNEGKEIYPDSESPAETLVDFVSSEGRLSEHEDLSNGDEITYSWALNDSTEDYLKQYFDVDLKYSDITFKVDDLSEADTFDAFDGVNLEFSGVSPNGSANVKIDGAINSLSESFFSVEPSSGLANGDVVTVSLNEDETFFMDAYKEIPMVMEKEFTVEGLPYFITELSQIPDDAMEHMKQQATDAYDSWVARDWNNDYETLLSFDFEGCYLLTPKEGFNTGFENSIYLVFKPIIQQHSKDEDGTVSDSEFSYYVYYRFEDGEILPDGTFSIDYSDYSSPATKTSSPTVYDYTQRWSWNQDHTLTLYGFDDMETLFNQVVTVNADRCNYETSVGEIGDVMSEA